MVLLGQWIKGTWIASRAPTLHRLLALECRHLHLEERIDMMKSLPEVVAYPCPVSNYLWKRLHHIERFRKLGSARRVEGRSGPTHLVGGVVSGWRLSWDELIVNLVVEEIRYLI
jgi:hypothetical protein